MNTSKHSHRHKIEHCCSIYEEAMREGVRHLHKAQDLINDPKLTNIVDLDNCELYIFAAATRLLSAIDAKRAYINQQYDGTEPSGQS